MATGKKQGKTKKVVVEKRGILDAKAKQTMLAVICRNPDVMERVHDLLVPADVRTIDDGYSLIYKLVKEFYVQYAELPEKKQLSDAFAQLAADHADELSETETDSIQEFIDLIYDKKAWGKSDISADETYAAIALKTFKLFMEERSLYALPDKILSNKKVPVDVAAQLRGVLCEVELASSIAAKQVPLIFQPGWMNKERDLPISSGLPVFDVFLGGGGRKKEVVGFLGPYGVCKTTIAVMGMCEGARFAQLATAQAKLKGNKNVKYMCVLASYEMPTSELQERCLSYLAQVPRKRLKKMTNLDKQLRTDGELEDYEKKLFKQQLSDGVQPPSERERVETAVALLNEYALFLDMTSSDPDNPHGSGGVKELSRILRNEQRRDKKVDLRFQSVWVDHAAAMVINMVGSEENYSVTDDSTRKLLRQVPKQLGDLIGKAFDVPVYVMHQMSGAANSRSPTAVYHHTDSDECKSFAMFLDFCIVTGNQTKDGRQLCLFDCTKHRREPSRRRQIVQIMGDFNKVRSVDKKYTVDDAQTRIMTWDEYYTLHGGKPVDKKKKKDDAAALAALAPQ